MGRFEAKGGSYVEWGTRAWLTSLDGDFLSLLAIDIPVFVFCDSFFCPADAVEDLMIQAGGGGVSGSDMKTTICFQDCISFVFKSLAHIVMAISTSPFHVCICNQFVGL